MPRNEPHSWPVGSRKMCRPRSWKTLIRWFSDGKIKFGDASKPHSTFGPSDPFECAVTIDGKLRYQLPKYHPDPPIWPYQLERMTGHA